MEVQKLEMLELEVQKVKVLELDVKMKDIRKLVPQKLYVLKLKDG